jgi:predicted dehydrogenase
METIKKLQDGIIGDIVTTRVYWNGAGVWVNPRKPGQTEMEYQMRNWYYFNWLCGDHIVEQHIHNLDVSNWLKNGYPVSAQGMGGREVRKGEDFGEIYDHHAVEFEYEDGSRMFSYCRHIPNCWNSVTEYAQGTKGTADISGATIVVNGQDPWKYRGPNSNPYQVEHDDLFASIRAGNPINEAEYGALSSMTAILGRMATYSGKMIKWTDAINSQISLMPKEFSFQATPPVPSVAVPGVTQVI